MSYVLAMIALITGVATAWGVSLLVVGRKSPLVASVPAVAAVVAAPVVALSVGAAPLWASALAALGGSIVGYTGAVMWLLREPSREARHAPRDVARDELRRPAVVYFTHGEPEFYDPEPWVNMLWELKHTGPGFPPRLAWPAILAGIQRSYRHVGTSPHGPIHEKTLEKVRAAVGRDDVDFRIGFLDANPPLRDAAYEVLDDGATDLVFLTVFLTESDHTQEADDMDEAMHLTEHGVGWVRTPVLWDDPRLSAMIADKVDRAAADRDRDTVGVVLVGHGQPHEWDKVHPSETEQEQAFRVSVTRDLLARGYREDLVVEGWMSFRDPKVPDVTRHIVERGARTVIGVPVTISADSLHSLYDTPELVRKGCIGSDVEVIDVAGWNDEDALVQILADRAREGLAALEADAKASSASSA